MRTQNSTNMGAHMRSSSDGSTPLFTARANDTNVRAAS